jgi:DHA1 family tetracycline resistance protein-like MFS transporter
MAEPTARPVSLGPVFLTVLLDLLGFGLVIPLLSFYVQSFDATPLQVTLVMACYSVAQFLCAPLWGALSDRVGRRPVMLVSIAGSVLFLSAFAASTELWMLYLFRSLHGACAANIGTAQAIVADVTRPADRARGMGMLGAAFGIGLTLGPSLGGLLAEYGLAVPIWVAAGLSAVNLVWAWRRLPETRSGVSGGPRRTLDPFQIARTLRHPGVGMAVMLAFVATFAFSMLEATFALVAEHEWSMTARTVGLLFGMIGTVGIVIQGGLIGRLTKRFGEGRLLTTGYLCMSCGMAVLAVTGPTGLWVGGGWLGIVGGCLLLAVGTSLANPSLSSLVSRGASADEQGTVLGVFQSLSALARASAPATGGAVYTAWYHGGPFAAGALMTLGALALSVPAARRAVTVRGIDPSARV